jgi:putative peptide zinc metalloprotease protein
LSRLFQFDLHLEEPPAIRLEQRVFVRFSHSPKPLWLRGYDSLRRLFLRRFAV